MNQDRNQQTGGVTFQGQASSKHGSYHGPIDNKQNPKHRELSPGIKENWRCELCKMWNVGCNRECSVCKINELNKKLQQQSKPFNPKGPKGSRYEKPNN